MLSNAFPINSDLYNVHVKLKGTGAVSNCNIKAYEYHDALPAAKLAIADLTLTNFTTVSIADVQQSHSTISLEDFADGSLDDIDLTSSYVDV